MPVVGLTLVGLSSVAFPLFSVTLFMRQLFSQPQRLHMEQKGEKEKEASGCFFTAAEQQDFSNAIGVNWHLSDQMATVSEKMVLNA